MNTGDFTWLDTDAETAAKRLLGCELIREIEGKIIRVRIVETEAYDQLDEASHTFRGRTVRSETMFQSAGHLYVYFTYGMYHCCNVVCGPKDFGSGVLIRAVEPLEGIEVIEKRRGLTGKNTTNGPGKICMALDIDLSLNGHYLTSSRLKLIQKPPVTPHEITTTTRIGISKAAQEMRRYYITDNAYISKK